MNKEKVTVYFETSTTAEKLATIHGESLYIELLPTLKKYAKRHRGYITESIE
tara:strand:+ start:860 stop:1015 length:156 start_codon:yes stop_codon:yes gene_type:complete